MFKVYVLYSPNHRKIYVGYTSDLQNRMDSHNIYSKKGYTPKFRPWEILFTEDYETKQEALKRENANERKFILKVAKDKYILK